MLALTADVGTALTTRPTLAEMLHGCAEAMVTHLDAAFARVWVMDKKEDVLVLHASAGLYTHLNGPHGRVPVGQFKIGLIAQENKPHLTNAVVGDPRVSDQEWAAREGMVAFAGYPLSVEGHVIGVVAMFARRPLSEVTLATLGAVADEIALGIEGKRTEAALRASERRLRDTQERLEAALSAGGIATWTWDLTTDLLVVDDNFARLFSVSPEDAAGGKSQAYFRAIHPEDRARVERAIAEAVDERDVYEAEYRVVSPDGSHRWLSAHGKVERDAEGKAVSLPGLVQDISERVERQTRERFLADLAERVRTLTDPDAVIADALRSVGQFLGASRCVFVDIEADGGEGGGGAITIHPDYRADGVTSMAGVFPISAFGQFVIDAYAEGRTVVVDDVRLDPLRVPEASLAAYEGPGIRAHVGAPVVHSARLVSCIGVHSATPRHWTTEEVALIQAVVERTWLTVEVTRQQRALVREAEERREAHERTALILESVTDGFYAIDRDWRFSYVNAQAEQMLQRPRQEMLGKNIWEAFPEAVGGTFYRVYRQAMEDGRFASVEDRYAPLDSWMDVRVYPSAAGLSVFFQNVSERKRAEAERERLLAEQRARAEREALLNRVGQALRGSPDPETVLGTAVRELGQALGADRCYYAAYDQDADTATVGPDWHRGGLPSIAGQYPMSRFAVNRDPVYRAGRTQVVADTAGDPATQALGLRALMRVPLVSGREMTALTAAMTDGPRLWTPEEMSLVEAVATQTQTALEAVRVREREHTIAQQLQDALQPAVPEHVPGLSVGRFTRPALDEASVGGDFYDIFPLDKNLFAVVIGDVSGKGLAAAQQLALIRNSLRTTLYLSRAPAQAASALNTIVTSHDLLVGFVTCWVGVYDAATGQVAYCSCGHEPGIVRRAGGAVEALETTGPPLGVAEGTEYAELSITLSSGDAMLLYTDGISECGPSRREMLGTQGLMRLLAGLEADAGAQVAADALLRDVSAFTNGVFRDDVAVLFLRRE
jgi:PAS domain S-box-containing protein